MKAIYLILALLLAPILAQADECRGHSCNGGGDVTVPVDVVAGSSLASSMSTKNTSRGFSIAGGDVDINDCYRSKGNALWQYSEVNLLCLAREAAAEGRWEAAARLRCEPRAVRRALGGRDACIDYFESPGERTAPPASQPPPVATDKDEDEDEHRRLLARIDELETRATEIFVTEPELEQRLARAAKWRKLAREALK